MLRELDRIFGRNVSERCQEQWVEILPKLNAIDKMEGGKAVVALNMECDGVDRNSGLCHTINVELLIIYN